MAAALLAAAALTGATGCSGSSSPPVPPTTGPTTAASLWTSGTTRLPGTLYVLAGPADISANVYEVSGAGQAMRALTANPAQYGISQFAASPAGVAVATAEHGFDQLRILTSAGSPTTTAAASAPSINAAGEVLTARPTQHRYVIDLYRPAAGGSLLPPSVFLPAGAHQSTAVWGPGSRVVTARRTEPGFGGPTELTLRNRAGRALRRTVVQGAYVDLISNAYPGRQPITGFRTDRVGGGLVFDARLAVVGTIDPTWTVGCWNPAGSRLLVTHGRTVGLWQRSTGRVTVMGQSRIRIRGCSWLTAPAAGTAAVATALAGGASPGE